MEFNRVGLEGAWLLELKTFKDHRGTFTRTFCKNELKEKLGIDFQIVQNNVSWSEHKHTLRGMHYQTGDSAEKKLVKCIHGRILDVIVDMRPESATYGKSFQVELSKDNNLMMLITEGFAHGFLTLEPNTLVNYMVTNYYNKASEKCIHWNDPYFKIKWPVDNPILSDTDSNQPFIIC